MELYSFLTRTMLIERLMGVGTYVLLLAIMYLAVRSAKNYNALRGTLNVYLILLCVMAFFFIPPQGADLYRWRVLTSGWGEMSISEYFESSLANSSTPLATFVMYICACIGIQGLLPMLSALVFYSNSFYIFKDLYRRHNVESRSLSVALFVFMSAGCFVEVISGVRCFTALSILARCFYDEIYNGKQIYKNIIWEIAAALIHSMALIFFCVRLAFAVLQTKKTFMSKLLGLLLVAVISVAFVSYGRQYVDFALNRALEYIAGEAMYSYIWEFLIGLLVLFQCLLALFLVDRRRMSRNMKDLFKFECVFVFMEVLFSFEYNIFHRTNAFLIIMMIPFVTLVVDQKRVRGIESFLTMVSLIVLLLACSRGNLCSYKFFLM